MVPSVGVMAPAILTRRSVRFVWCAVLVSEQGLREEEVREGGLWRRGAWLEVVGAPLWGTGQRSQCQHWGTLPIREAVSGQSSAPPSASQMHSADCQSLAPCLHQIRRHHGHHGPQPRHPLRLAQLRHLPVHFHLHGWCRLRDWLLHLGAAHPGLTRLLGHEIAQRPVPLVQPEAEALLGLSGLLAPSAAWFVHHLQAQDLQAKLPIISIWPP